MEIKKSSLLKQNFTNDPLVCVFYLNEKVSIWSDRDFCKCFVECNASKSLNMFDADPYTIIVVVAYILDFFFIKWISYVKLVHRQGVNIATH